MTERSLHAEIVDIVCQGTCCQGISGVDHGALAARIIDVIEEQVQEALTGALHPEFGTEWRGPDGAIFRAVAEAEFRVRREQAKVGKEITEQAVERARAEGLEAAKVAVILLRGMGYRLVHEGSPDGNQG